MELRPTPGGPGALSLKNNAFGIAHNGRLYANPWRASASHGLVERSERYASVAKPEEPKDTNDERVQAC
jgi:hypothetical protein